MTISEGRYQSTAAPVDWADVRRLVDRVNAAIEEQTVQQRRSLTEEQQRQAAMDAIGAELQSRSRAALQRGDRPATMQASAALRDAVMSSMFGLGRLAELLEEDVEDVYIHGTRPVVLKFAGGALESRPPVAETDEDLVAQIESIARYQGMNERGITESNPFLNMNLVGHHARLAFVYKVTPFPIVTIRRHRFVNIGLEQLVAMGSISRAMMAYLQAVVMARKSILVVGGQATGKTTLLRALALCLPSTARFATLETEYELLLHEDADRFPLLVPYEERQGSGERDEDGRPAGAVTLASVFPESLRHSLERILFGEVRGREILACLEAFSRGHAGSMGTFHANSAEEALEAMATLNQRYMPSLTHEAALREVAQAVDVVVFLDRENTVAGEMRYVREILEVTGSLSASGRVQASHIFAPHSKADPRGYSQGLTTEKEPEWLDRAGLDKQWLTRPDLSAWDKPFPERFMGR